MRAPVDRPAVSGFTLLELLVAISLLGLVFAALTGGLRFGTAAWRSAADRVSHSEDMRLVYRILRRQLSTALPVPGGDNTGRSGNSFDGREDRVSFIGPAPARSVTPGLFRMTLALEPDAGTQALTLRWRRLESPDDRSRTEDREPVLRGVRSIELSYFGQGADDRAPRWVKEWRDEDRMPGLIRVAIHLANADRTAWPEMIVPVVTRE